jgi:hypothetical protein
MLVDGFCGNHTLTITEKQNVNFTKKGHGFGNSSLYLADMSVGGMNQRYESEEARLKVGVHYY